VPTITIPLGPGSDPARSDAMGQAVLINCYPEAAEQGRRKFALYTDLGLETLVTIAAQGTVRGLFNIGTSLYAVVNESLYKVAINGTTTLIGTVVGNNPVIVAVNKKAGTPQAAIVSDSIVYTLENDTVVTFADADLPSQVHSCCYLDGYTIFGTRNARFYITGLNDHTVDALDFSTAEGSPDDGVRVFTSGRDLYYFGEDSTEVYSNTGNTEFPFERAAFIPVGCKSKYTPCNFDNTVVWVDHFGRVVRAEQNTVRRISNHGVERDIQATIDAGQAGMMEAFSYVEGGHEFYQLSGPTWTWVYDASTQLWRARESYGIGRSRIRHYIRFGDRHIVGDYASGKLYLMKASAFDEAGSYLVTTIRSPVMGEPGVGASWDSIILDMQMGVGRGIAPHGAAPKVSLRWSDDGCATWKGPRERSLGALGQYQGRIQFNDLGASGMQGRAFEISISAPVERCLIGANAVIRYTGPR
jgi:hypothetical protein